jgi:DNA-directed RNA polymerase subunit RPC12/RpoP
MKVLKAGEIKEPQLWSMRHVCPYCQSQLLVEELDIYCYHEQDIGGYDESVCKYKCGFCWKLVSCKSHIPSSVRGRRFRRDL